MQAGTAPLRLYTLGLVALAVLVAMAASMALPLSTMLALPLAAGAVLAATLLLLVQRRMLVLLMLALRASCDALFEALKGDSGGAGIGAAVNALLIVVASLELARRPHRARQFILPLWLPFLLVATCSALLAPERDNAIRLLLVQLSYAAAFALPLCLVRHDADIRHCLLAVLAASLVPVGAALAELAAGSAVADEAFRLHSTFTHPNVFAFFLLVELAVILYLQQRHPPVASPFWRGVLWLYATLLLALLVATQTRSAWAGALLLFGAYGFFFQRRFLIYALFIPLLLWLDPGVRERLQDVANPAELSGNTDLNSYAWRLVLWRSGLEWMQASHSLLGYGLDSFKYYSPRFFPLQGRDTWDPHNVYIQLYFETGVAGLLAFLGLFACLLRRLRLGLSSDRAGATVAMATVAAYLLIAYADNLLYYLSVNWYFWFFAGTCCAAGALPRPAATASAH